MKRRIILGLIIYLTIIFLGHLTHGSIDAIQRLNLTQSIFLEGSVITSKYGPIRYAPLQSVLMVPPYAMGYTVGKLMGEPKEGRHRIGYRFCAFLFIPIITSFVCVLFFEILGKLGFDLSLRLFSTFSLLFGTLLLPYSKLMFSEPLNALFILLSLNYFLRSFSTNFRVNNRLNFLFLGFLCLNNFIFIFYYCLMIIFVFFSSRKFLVVRKNIIAIICESLVLLFIIFSVVLIYNNARYGAYFQAGYEDVENAFGTPLIEGVYGLLFSFGRGLAFYSSLTFICILFFIFQYHKLELKIRLLFCLYLSSFFCYLLIYGKWISWEGGWCWGPRYLLPFVPAIHILFPFLVKSVLKANIIVRGGFFVICFVALIVNLMEYVGVWQGYQGATFNSGEIPYWYSLYVPQYSFVFNNWDWGVGMKRLTQFVIVAGFSFYFGLIWFKKRFQNF